MTGGAGALTWRPSERDRAAEVDHVDGRRRPWRAGVVAALVAALVTVLAPWPPPWQALAAALLAAALAAVASWQFPMIRSGRGLGARTPPEITLDLQERALTVWRGGLERRVAPDAVERLVVDIDHVFLHLAESEVLTVPCRVFDAERGSLDRFVARVDRLRRAGDPLPDAPEPDRREWLLQYGSRGVGLGADNARAGDLERLVLAGLLAVGCGLVLAVGGRWGGPDVMLLGVIGLVGAAMVGVSGRRSPVGLVDLGVGPAGGWVRSRAGSVRFGWDRVLGVEVSPRLVVLRFADRVVPVPSEAFEHEPERLRFIGDVRDWWRAARPSARAAPNPPAEGPPADPFAAPAEG